MNIRYRGISKLLVDADELRDRSLVEKFREEEKVIWLIRSQGYFAVSRYRKDIRIELPENPLTRGQVLRIGLFLSVLRGFIEVDEGVLFLSQGPSDRGASATF